jgi:nitroreductase
MAAMHAHAGDQPVVMPGTPDLPVRGGDLRAHAEEIVWAATRAPSYRDTQPWSFRVTAHQVEVYADLGRSSPAADPVNRQLFLSVGAAVFGIRLALARLGLRPIVGITGDHDRPDLAAVVVSGGSAGCTGEDDELYGELIRRPTAGSTLLGETVPVQLRAELAEQVRHGGVAARWVSRAADRSMLSDLVRRTAEDLRGQRISSPDPPFVRTPPAVLVICTPADHRADWLRAGQAAHHALLLASRSGLGGTVLNDLLEVPPLRARLRQELGLPGLPQVLLGLGRPAGPLPPPTLHRPVAEVLKR